MNEPQLSLDQAKAVVATKTAPRVTEQSLKDQIGHVDYISHETLTICVIEMLNGFYVTGISAPASKANFDYEVGKRYAYENAFKQLWQLEGYLLRWRIYQGEFDAQ